MSKFNQIAKKAVKKTVVVTLTTGVVISIGLLSYCGMLVISPSLILAYSAFVLAGVVDGEVFWQNITGGINQLKLLRSRGLDALIIDELDKLLEDKDKLKSIDSLKEYKQYKKYVAAFEGKQLTDKQHQAKKQATKTLHRMQKVLVARILSAECPADLKIIQDQLPALRKKHRFIRIGVPISVGSGIAFGFATAAALSTALVTITPVLALAMWPLAAIACVGYALLIYNTITDILCNDTIKEWRQEIARWFNKPAPAQQHAWIDKISAPARKIIVGFILALGISVGILATLATAGTWWLAVKAGARLLPTASRFASMIRNILVPVAAGANLVFTIRNTLTSVQENIGHHHHEEKKEKVKKPAPNISWGQRLNPFRFISALIKTPFRLIIFIGHLIAIGLTGDRAPGLSYRATIASAFFGALSDAFVDWHYIFNINHDHGHQHHGHKHEHSHGLVTNFALNVALSPILVLSALWDYAATPNKTLADALRSSFDIKKRKPLTSNEEPAYSKETGQAIIEHRLAKQKSRLEHAWIGKDTANQKIAVLNKIEVASRQPSSAQNPTPILNNADLNTLKKRRSLFSNASLFSATKETKTARVAQEVVTYLGKR